jgi:serine/threonine-protein kinase
MAELFLATRADSSPDDPPLVIKRMLPSMGENPDFCSMFLNEASLAAQLIHPNIVRVLDLGQVDDQLYVALEFIDGQDLSVLLTAHGRLAAPVAARIGLGVCEALAYAHEARDLEGRPLDVVHRDVSPDNVMVTRHGGIKLIDFGIAKVLSRSGLTRPGIIKGKYGYIAPEYMRGLGLDGRADLFSLGALLYETVTGAQPFERANAEETMARVLSFEPHPPTELVPSCPREFSAIVMRALEKSPECRYASARQMGQELKAFLEACGEHVGAAELAALTWGPTSEDPQQQQQQQQSQASQLAPERESLEPSVGADAGEVRQSQSAFEATGDGPPTVPILGAFIPTRVDRPTRILARSEPAKPSLWRRAANVVGLGALLAGAALLGRLSATTGDAKVAPAAASDAQVLAVVRPGPAPVDAAETGDAAGPAESADAAPAASDAGAVDPDAAAPGPDAGTAVESRDAGSGKADAGRAERVLLQIKGRGTVLVDGKACQAPCTVKVQPGSHVVERTGKKRFRRTVQVPAGATYVFTTP